MLTQLGTLCRRVRRRFSRSRLISRWMGFAPDAPDSDQPGLVILQLDGLSRTQFEAALRKGRLPFLKSLRDHGDASAVTFYSGIPSTTPAVQAEVMYGVPCAVPAFQFLHRASGDVFRMYEHECARTVVEQQLAEGEPLLEGGASCSNIYSGGAETIQGCVDAMDLRSLLSQLNPLRLLLLLPLYIVTMFRIAALAAAEVLIAVYDMFTGMTRWREWKSELKFVASRVLISIVLRESLRIVTKVSIARGLPVIYANFLGYDEQSHRRGPSSRFAHWGLKGIDGVLRDIARAARRSDARDYKLVVFSDHGQEHVRVYDFVYEQSIDEAVRRAFRSGPLAQRVVHRHDGHRRDDSAQRARRLMRIHRGRRATVSHTAGQQANDLIVTAMGPIGHVYFPFAVPDEAKVEYARILVEQEHVPLVIGRLETGEVVALNADGRWQLPDEAAAVCGADHPFLTEITDDLLRLTRHTDAGDLVIAGWAPGRRPVTFSEENGAHGSIGTEETRGFALLPPALAITRHRNDHDEAFVRGRDLHDAALRFLERRHHPVGPSTCSPPRSDSGRGSATTNPRSPRNPTSSPAAAPHPPPKTPADHSPPAPPEPPEPPRQQPVRPTSSESATAEGVAHGLRILTWNIHHCEGMDGKCRPARIADVIARFAPDVVALQEVDRNRRRSDLLDQAAEIAARLGLNERFFPVESSDDEQYGLALLSRHAFLETQTGLLSDTGRGFRREARGVMRSLVDWAGDPVHVLNTHLGLTARERRRQVDTLLSSDWLGGIPDSEPVILCGDLNAGPDSPVLRELSRRFTCVQRAAVGHRPQNTFASIVPVRRIDHILVSPHFRVASVTVPTSQFIRSASDHLPVVTELTRVPDPVTSVPTSNGSSDRSPKSAVARTGHASLNH